MTLAVLSGVYFQKSHFIWQNSLTLKVICHSATQDCTMKCKWLSTEKNNFLLWSVADDFRSLTAWEKKLLCSLEVWKRILLYLLSDGSSVNRLQLGRVLCFSILWALCRHPTSLVSCNVHKIGTIDFQEVLLTCVRAFFTGPYTNLTFLHFLKKHNLFHLQLWQAWQILHVLYCMYCKCYLQCKRFPLGDQ